MINGRITITDVDYNHCFRSLFPKLIEKSQTIEKPGVAIRFLNKMGNDSMPIVLRIMDNMSGEEKEALLLAIMESNHVQINKALNKYLGGHELGNAIQIGEIHSVKMNDGAGFSLVITNVKIDYNALMKTNLVSRNVDSYVDMVAGKFGAKGAGFLKGATKLALNVGVKAAPEEMEKKAIALINREDINEKLLDVLKEGLEKIGLYLQVKDIVLMQAQEEPYDRNIIEVVSDDDMKFRLPESVEESLLDAIVTYLKENK